MEPTSPAAPPTRAEIERLIDVALSGSRSELATLREVMAAYPDEGRHYDLAQITVRTLVQALPGDKAYKAMTHGRVDSLRRELGGDYPSPIERLLIDQIVLTYIHLNQVEYQMARLWEESITPATVVFWEERLDRCQRRYLRAIKTLADVRRQLRLPPIQINIADKQVNITEGNGR